MRLLRLSILGAVVVCASSGLSQGGDFGMVSGGKTAYLWDKSTGEVWWVAGRKMWRVVEEPNPEAVDSNLTLEQAERNYDLAKAAFDEAAKAVPLRGDIFDKLAVGFDEKKEALNKAERELAIVRLREGNR